MKKSEENWAYESSNFSDEEENIKESYKEIKTKKLKTKKFKENELDDEEEERIERNKTLQKWGPEEEEREE